MKTTSELRTHAPQPYVRLYAAILITITLLLTVGCSSAPNHHGAAQSTNSTGGSATPISDTIQEGKNPFEVAGIQNPKAALTVFEALKAAIAQGNKAEVANHILYPLHVNNENDKRLIQTRGEFVKQYDTIITQSIKDAIANQSAEELFANYQGIMIGNGEIWLGGSTDSPQVVGIIAINHITRTR